MLLPFGGVSGPDHMSPFAVLWQDLRGGSRGLSQGTDENVARICLCASCDWL